MWVTLYIVKDKTTNIYLVLLENMAISVKCFALLAVTLHWINS